MEGIGIAIIRGTILALTKTKENLTQDGRSFERDSNWEPPFYLVRRFGAMPQLPQEVVVN